jgi:hypothetical protein
MKTIILVCIANVYFNFCFAQTESKAPSVDKSPMDMSYFPDQYPIQKFQGKTSLGPTIRIIYGRPQKEGRTIFGDLIKYNELWRVGANEATEIEFFKPVKIGGKTIPKGRYTFYCIPTEKEWTFVFNKDTDSWGAFKYDITKDILRTKVKVTSIDTVVESLSIYFSKTTSGANLIVSWDKTSGILPISF